MVPPGQCGGMGRVVACVEPDTVSICMAPLGCEVEGKGGVSGRVLRIRQPRASETDLWVGGYNMVEYYQHRLSQHPG
jgi:hypothetical protein